ncbi:MAG TPA: hypothetical protein VMV74_07985 [Bacteroidales bacterium]|nr:hypothetical protein [Bacteroidales bacterium]
MTPDREKFKNFIKSLVELRAKVNGTTRQEELNKLNAETLERRLKRDGLLKDEAPVTNHSKSSP